ncbi:hypothetical protein G7046_g6791 [Stylonectria norvegica]|nr:hypothetical protein G7046_g6791 [Stylonectria norvegica]
MPTPGVHISETGKKSFIPLENNPEVFTALVRDLGLAPDLEFHDVYSLDEALLSFIPRPALALIFISPPPMYAAVRAADGTRAARDGLSYDGSGSDEPVVWYRQIIGNACGLIALLHAVSNGPAVEHITPGSTLDKLLKEITPLKPLPRAEVLNQSEALEAAHMRAAGQGDTAAPQAEQVAPHHFLAFVKGKDGHLWELEGSSDGPIDRGLLRADEDMLSEGALEKGIGKYLKAANGELDFSMIALADISSDGGYSPLHDSARVEYVHPSVFPPAEHPMTVYVLGGRDVVFVYHHLVGDGMSGMAFHRTFLRALNTLSRDGLGELEALEPVDAATTEILPPSKPYFKSITEVAPPEERTVSRISSTRIASARMEAILAACRANGTTFTPLLVVMLTATMATDIFPKAKIACSRYAYDIRPHIRMPQLDGIERADGVVTNAAFNGTHIHWLKPFRALVGGTGKATTVDAAAAWQLVRDYKQKMNDYMPGPGMRSWIGCEMMGPNLEDMVNQAYPAVGPMMDTTFMVTNVGALAPGSDLDRSAEETAWRIDDVQFSVAPTNGTVGNAWIVLVDFACRSVVAALLVLVLVLVLVRTCCPFPGRQSLDPPPRARSPHRLALPAPAPGPSPPAAPDGPTRDDKRRHGLPRVCETRLHGRSQRCSTARGRHQAQSPHRLPEVHAPLMPSIPSNRSFTPPLDVAACEANASTTKPNRPAKPVSKPAWAPKTGEFHRPFPASRELPSGKTHPAAEERPPRTEP